MSVQYSFTSIPSAVIGCDLDNNQFFRASTRTGALFGEGAMQIASAVLQDVIEADSGAQAIPSQFGTKHYIKLRSIFLDDKNGHVTLNVDYVHDNDEQPRFTKTDVARLLGDGEVRHLGQSQSVLVSIKAESFSSDSFSPVKDEHYI